MNDDELESIIRQHPNKRAYKLMLFNAFRPEKISVKRQKLNEKVRQHNREQLVKQDSINAKRIRKARAKGNDFYTKKILKLKDTVEYSLFFREWLKYKIGESPVIFDSTLMNKSVDQVGKYLKKKGFYQAQVSAEVSYKPTKKKVKKVTYFIDQGPVYKIDSVALISRNSTVRNGYEYFINHLDHEMLIGQNFDEDLLDDYRYLIARSMRDNAMYGFSANHVHYEAFTNDTNMTVRLNIIIDERMIYSTEKTDSLEMKLHRTHKIRNVYFHVLDTTQCGGKYQFRLDSLGLSDMDGQYMRTLDTMQFRYIIHPKTKELDLRRVATFYYNGELFLRPELIEIQNFLEYTQYYKEKYIERSYARFQQLDLFQVIKPVLIEIPQTNEVDVHYYLTPSKKQSFNFEPRTTTSNGFLGVSLGINYTNKNLFRGAEKLTFAISGGFESQPPIFESNAEGVKVLKSSRSFNTFEIGPSIKLELPGLFPFDVTKLSKRHMPKTIISSAYNFQQRMEFTREIFQMNFAYKFSPDKTQIFQLGLPFASVIKFVQISQLSDAFKSLMFDNNDLFLINTYSNQFVWQDWKVNYEFNNKNKESKMFNKASIYYSGTFDLAGMTISFFKNHLDTNATGQYQWFGLPYTQFARVDNEFIFSYPVFKKQSVHFRALAGAGVPVGNSKVSMPYDYSFFAGGANDVRGFKARSLGPGSYKYYLDSTSSIQVGDIRMGASTEYRFAFTNMWKAAVFLDAGNVWTVRKDNNRPGSQFSKDWFEQVALCAGFGLRIDMDFFVLRFDFGLPIYEPSLPKGARWITSPRTLYNAEINALTYADGTAYTETSKNNLPKPFTLKPTFGIGFPF
jgi:outer membrane protein insertion porin family